MVHFNLFLYFLFPASGYRGLLKLRFDPCGKITEAAVYFHWEAHDVWFFYSFLTFAAVDPYCLDLLIRWGLQNGDILILPFLFYLLAGIIYKDRLPFNLLFDYLVVQFT